jgi:hypothetical protein
MAKLLTLIGRQKMLVADPLNPVVIKSIAIGTGTGTFDENILSLESEVWRGDASAPKKENGILSFSAYIPSTVGNWTVSEWGWIDDEGDLIAYGHLDNPIYKSSPVMEIELELAIELSNSLEAELFVTDSLNWEHNKMTGRDASDAHPIGSITGLDDALSDLQNNINTAENNLKTSINLDRKYKKVEADYTILNSDGGILEINASNGPLTITMPKSTNFTSKEIILVRTDDTNNIVSIIAADSGDSYFGEGTLWTNMFIRAKEVIQFKAGENIFTGLRGSTVGLYRDSTGVNLIENGLSTDKIILESNIVNNLTTNDTKKPLSAAQGKNLNDKMFGVGQTWKNVTSQRVAGTTYTNTTPRPIQIGINANMNNGSINLGGAVIPWDDNVYYTSFWFVVPPNTTYTVNLGSEGQIYAWGELS